MSAVTGAGFQAFSAATQGDWDRAAVAVRDITREEWPAFVAAVDRLSDMAFRGRDEPRKHRVCDNCLKGNHTGCTDPCGCTSVDRPSSP